MKEILLLICILGISYCTLSGPPDKPLVYEERKTRRYNCVIKDGKKKKSALTVRLEKEKIVFPIEKESLLKTGNEWQVRRWVGNTAFLAHPGCFIQLTDSTLIFTDKNKTITFLERKYGLKSNRYRRN